MAHNDETRQSVRNSYIYERLDLKASAKKHDVPYSTARIWKRNAESKGDNWDFARNASRQSAGPAGDLSLQILEDFAIQYQSIMEDVREDKDLKATQRADVLTKLGDSYVKVMKIAGGNDNKIAKLSISIDTIKLLSNFIEEQYPQHLEAFSSMLDRFGPVVTKHYG
ncbi:MAG: DUF1804 family protein [Pseudomonadota bacterium]